MLANTRLSVLVLITAVVLLGLSVIPSAGKSVIHAAQTNYQTLAIRLADANGHWYVNGTPTRGLVVSVPPKTSLELMLDDHVKDTIQSVQFVPIHETKRRQFQVFPATSTNGLLIDSSQLKSGRYKCKVTLDRAIEGATQDIVFDIAITPAVSRPNLVRTGTE